MEIIPNNIFEMTLQGYAKGFHVSQIATFGLETCSPDEDIKEVFDRLPSFDQIPVKQLDRIIGVLERNGKTQDGLVEQHYKSLDDSILASADEALSAFLLSMEKPPYYRLVVKGTKIDGIVTRSDILKLPVRLYIFALITNLELLMTEIIQQHFSNENEWMNLISEGRRGLINQNYVYFKKSRLDPPKIELSNFCDKYTIIEKKFHLKDGFRSDMAKIEKNLRNPIAHARSYTENEDNLRDFLELLQKTIHWTEELNRMKS